MSYQKAIDILPNDIMEQIQQYIDGEYLYIPRKKSNQKLWGESTATKKLIADRNQRIYLDYLNGIGIIGLAEKYYLAEKSIQRIIKQEKQKEL